MNFINEQLCMKCGGSCCKSMGCHLSPEDIKDGVTYSNLEKLLDTGLYSIDWWEEYEIDGMYVGDGYYIRVRNENSPIVDPAWSGRCILLTESGCPLSFENRPKGGRDLEPRDGRCVNHYTKLDSVNDWHKYHNILKTLYNKY